MITEDVLEVLVEQMDLSVKAAVDKATLPLQDEIKRLSEELAGKDAAISELQDESLKHIEENIVIRTLLDKYNGENVSAVNDISEQLKEAVVSLKDRQTNMLEESEVATRGYIDSASENLEVELRMKIQQEGTRTDDLFNAIQDIEAGMQLSLEEESNRHKDGLASILEVVQNDGTSEKLDEFIESQSKSVGEVSDTLQLFVMDELKRHDACIQKARSDDYVRVMELLNEFRSSPDVRRTVEWEPGVTYDIGTQVRFAGGIWSNLRTTSDNPAESDNWVCLSTGIDRIEVLDQHPNGVRATIGVFDSLGKSTEVSFDLPRVQHLAGSWVEDAEYRQLDSVLSDGVRWIANKDMPTGKPGDSEDWTIESMRGPAGKRGPKGMPGPRGEPGPVAEIDRNDLEQVVRSVGLTDENSIRRFMGNWSSGIPYVAGDIVKYSSGLWFAKKDHQYSITPDQSMENWEFIGGIDE